MDEPTPNPVIALDEHIANDWFLIALVTNREYASVGLKPGKRLTVLEAFAEGDDPIETLKKHAPFGQPPRIVPLSSIEALEWHADDTELYVRYFDEKKQKSRRGRSQISTAGSRNHLIDKICGDVGECEITEEPASIWHVGLAQLIFSGIAILICWPIAIAGFLDPRPANVDGMRRGRAIALAALYNAVGPMGMFLIGLAIVTAMMVWWYIACRNPPVKSVARFRRTA